MFCVRGKKNDPFLCEVSKVGEILEFLQYLSLRATVVLFQYETL